MLHLHDKQLGSRLNSACRDGHLTAHMGIVSPCTVFMAARSYTISFEALASHLIAPSRAIRFGIVPQACLAQPGVIDFFLFYFASIFPFKPYSNILMVSNQIAARRALLA